MKNSRENLQTRAKTGMKNSWKEEEEYKKRKEILKEEEYKKRKI